MRTNSYGLKIGASSLLIATGGCSSLEGAQGRDGQDGQGDGLTGGFSSVGGGNEPGAGAPSGGSLQGSGGAASSGGASDSGGTTNGSGGAVDGSGGQVDVPGLPCDSETTIGDNVKMCETTLDGMALKFVPLEEDEPAVKVGLYFHGDDAHKFNGTWTIGPLGEWGREHKVVFGMFRCPYFAGPDDDPYVSWKGAESDQTVATGDAIQKYAEAFGVSSRDVFIIGTSGGSTFVVNKLIPWVGHRFPGLYAANCGAGTPDFYDGAGWDPEVQTEVRDQIKIRYHYGAIDWTSYGIKCSADYHEDLGFAVSRNEIPQPGMSEDEAHCNFDLLDASLAFFLSE